ncbi:MAG: hypothetical protein ACFCVF_04400 [Kineosporiaceae bacterium]
MTPPPAVSDIADPAGRAHPAAVPPPRAVAGDDGPTVRHRSDRERLGTSAFTMTLRRQLGGDVYADRVDSGTKSADAAMAGRLDVPPGHPLVARLVILRTAATGAAIAVGESYLAVERLLPAERVALQTSDRPLGDVLDVQACDRILLGGAPGGRRGWIAEVLSCTPDRLLGRTTVIIRGGRPLTVVSEWWQTCDEEHDR